MKCNYRYKTAFCLCFVRWWKEKEREKRELERTQIDWTTDEKDEPIGKSAKQN